MSDDKHKNPIYRTPADMHADGVHFDPKIKEALKAERDQQKREIDQKVDKDENQLRDKKSKSDKKK